METAAGVDLATGFAAGIEQRRRRNLQFDGGCNGRCCYGGGGDWCGNEMWIGSKFR